jgi:phosphoglycolate phosphatase/pyrophosphatase PpaX
MDYCFDPGFFEYCTRILALDSDEMHYEYKNWKRFVAEITPHACPGMAEIIRYQREAGGIICTVSHSEKENILRDWRSNFDSAPDAVYGWDAGEGKRKPHPFPVFDIAEKFSLELSDIIVIDDLKHGFDMAKNAGVAFAAALWAQPSRLCREFMKNNADACFYDTASLERYLFE